MSNVAGGAKSGELTCATGISGQGDEAENTLRDLNWVFKNFIELVRLGQEEFIRLDFFEIYKRFMILGIANMANPKAHGFDSDNRRLLLGYVKEYQLPQCAGPYYRIFSGSVVLLSKTLTIPASQAGSMPAFLQMSDLEELESYAIANIQFKHKAFGYTLPEMSWDKVAQDSLLILCNKKQWPTRHGWRAINNKLVGELTVLTRLQVRDLEIVHGLTWKRMYILYSADYNIETVAQLKQVLATNPPEYP